MLAVNGGQASRREEVGDQRRAITVNWLEVGLR